MQRSGMLWRSFGVGSLLLAILGQALHADPPYWHREVVDSGGDYCGYWCSLAFDAEGNPAIAYVDGNEDIVVSRFDPNTETWTKATVADEDHLGRVSLAFRADGVPFVAYIAEVPSDANYPEVLDGWSPEVASEGAGGWSDANSPIMSVAQWAFAPTGRPKIAFNGSGQLWVVYAMNGLPFPMVWGWALCATPASPDEWAVGIIDLTELSLSDVNIRGISLAIEPNNDQPAVSYRYKGYELDALTYAVYNGTGLPNMSQDPNAAWPKEYPYGADPNDPNDDYVSSSCLAFGPSGGPAIGGLWRKEGNPDSVAFVELGSQLTSIALADHELGLETPDFALHYRGDGNPGVSYQSYVSVDEKWLMYAWLDPNDPNDPNGVWQIRRVDWLGKNGTFHSLATDPNGLPAIAYHDATEKRLVYAVTSDVPDTYTLTLSTSGGGSIERDPEEDANWDAYVYGTVVTLTAVPDSDSRAFTEWLEYDPNHPGDANYAESLGKDNPIQVIMDRDRRIRAEFICVIGGGNALPCILVALTMGLVKLQRRRR